MLEIQNRTPFEVALFPGLDKEGYDQATVLVKGTFDLRTRGPEPMVSEEQAKVTHGDQFHGDPETSSVKYESDGGPAKAGTDVVLIGHAYTSRRAAGGFADVGLAAGPLRKTVRVFGDRCWVRAAGSWEMSRPLAFERMPLVYERAFGGADTSDPAATAHAYEQRNPVGTGFTTGKRAAQIDGLRLPNLEDPLNLIENPGDKPAPAGFGFIGRSWLPRMAFAGTYDERWKAERCPFLPLDFDDRHHRGAHPDLTAPYHFRGGEPVIVSNASDAGEVRFNVPARAVEVAVSIKGVAQHHRPALDTIVIEPDARRVVLSWRATFRCPKTFLYIEAVRVREAKAA